MFTERMGEASIHSIKFSDVLYDTCRLWYKEPTRENLQLIPQCMEFGFGKGALSDIVRARIGACTSDIVIADGVRWKTDEDLLRSFPSNLLVYVTASPKTRFRRLRGRNEKKGEGELTWTQFMRESSAPNEVLIPEIGSRADFVIYNEEDGSDVLTRSVTTFIEQFRTALI